MFCIKDKWSYYHFLGSVLLTMLFYILIHDIIGSMFFALFCGWLWEIADDINMSSEWHIKILDSSGFSWRDILIDLHGVVVGGLILIII